MGVGDGAAGRDVNDCITSHCNCLAIKMYIQLPIHSPIVVGGKDVAMDD